MRIHLNVKCRQFIFIYIYINTKHFEASETRKNKRHLSSFRCEIRDFFYKLKVIKTMNKILSVSDEDEKEIFR